MGLNAKSQQEISPVEKFLAGFLIPDKSIVQLPNSKLQALNSEFCVLCSVFCVLCSVFCVRGLYWEQSACQEDFATF